MHAGKVFRLIQRLYDNNEGNFRLGVINGTRIGWSTGLGQGCVLSPFVCNVYLESCGEVGTSIDFLKMT